MDLVIFAIGGMVGLMIGLVIAAIRVRRFLRKRMTEAYLAAHPVMRVSVTLSAADEEEVPLEREQRQ